MKKSPLCLLLIMAALVGTVPATFFSYPVWAQAPTCEPPSTEAQRWLDEGTEQNNQGNYEAALTSLEQALVLFQQSCDPSARLQVGHIFRLIGNVYSSQGNYDRTVEYQQQALAIAQELQDRDLESRAINNLGVIYERRGDLGRAVENYHRALQLAREIDSAFLQKIFLSNLIRVFTSQDNPTAAAEQIQQLTVLAERTSDAEMRLSIHIDAANAYFKLKDYPQAITYAQQSLVLAQELQATDSELQALNILTESYYLSQDYTRAIAAAEQELTLARQSQNQTYELFALYNLGLIYQDLEDYPTAMSYAQQSQVLADKIGNSSIEQSALDVLRQSYSGLKRSSTNPDEAQQQLTRTYAGVDVSYQQQALQSMANAYSSNQEHGLTLEVSQLALALAEQTQNQEQELQALAKLSWAAYQTKDYPGSIEALQRGLVIARANQNQVLQSAILRDLSDNYYSLSQYQAGVDAAREAASISHQIEDFVGEAKALIKAGLSYNSWGQYTNAIALTEQALAISQKLENRELEATALLNLSNNFNALSRYSESLEVSEQAIATAREIEDKELEARALLNRSSTYDSLAQYQPALDLAEQGLAIAREISHAELEARSLNRLSDTYDSLDEYSKSIPLAEQALAIAQEIQDPSVEVFALSNLVSAYDSLGAYEQVAETTQAMIAAGRRIGNPAIESLGLMMLSYLAFLDNDIPAAIEYGEQVQTLSQTSDMPYLKAVAPLFLSLAYGETENYAYAVELAESSLANAQALGLQDIEGIALNLLGGLHRRHDQPAQAIALHQQALVLATSQEETSDAATSHAGLARSYRALDMPTTAIAHYKQAINRIEAVRGNIKGLSDELQASFLNRVVDFDNVKLVDLYRELADLLLAQDRVLEAQQVLELLKAQELQDFTRGDSAAPNLVLNSLETQIQQEHGTLIAFGQKVSACEKTECSDLSVLYKQLDALTVEFQDTLKTVESTVRERLPDDRGALDTEDFLRKAQEIVEAKPGTVLVYPLVLEDRLWLLWASEGGVVARKQVEVDQKTLNAAVLRFRELLGSPHSDLAQLQATGQQLYQWLVQPIEAELERNQIHNLVFSLDRSVRYIPMAALHDGDQYLIEKYAVSTILSADLTDLGESFPTQTENPSILAMGTSDAVGGFPPLPNVPTEIDSIVRVEGSDQGIYQGLKFFNGEFDFETLRRNLSGHSILHLATHGEFQPGQPKASYLLLGNGERLEIPKISTLRQLDNVHLVVLSACETGLGGRDPDGIEVGGISYYFLSRGALSVMASLWKVNDSSTSTLMQRFYAILAESTDEQPITKAEALRQAQLSLLLGNDYEAPNWLGASRASVELITLAGTPISSTSNPSHPYYWAPFILIGNHL